MNRIFKIVEKTTWQTARRAGCFEGAEIDLQDGFIHFSSADQVEQTANLHFAGRSNLLLVAVSAEKLGDNLKWEESRGGQLFPHLYAPLDLKHVVWIREIRPDAEGVFRIDLSVE
jgi:uncharacterized protein (DUF952 family)